MLLGLEELKQTDFYQLLHEQAVEQGLEQGLEQGQVLALRSSLLDIRTIRFTTVPTSVGNSLTYLQVPDTLRLLVRQAILVPTLTEFRQKVVEALVAQMEGMEDDCRSAVQVALETIRNELLSDRT